jgi:hypothetical protein
LAVVASEQTPYKTTVPSIVACLSVAIATVVNVSTVDCWPTACMSQYLCYLPIDLHHRRRQKSDMSLSISVPPGFLGHSQWRILKKSWNAVLKKYPLF